MPFNRKLLNVLYIYTVLSRQLSFGKIVRGFSAKCSGIVAQKLSQLQGLHGITLPSLRPNTTQLQSYQFNHKP